MRTLILLRGLPGSGKSTFIESANLTPHTLSADTLRMLYASPIFTTDGGERIPGEYDRNVWAKLFELLEARMSRGELVVVDATHTHPRSFKNYEPLVRKYRYRTICIDFSDVPFAECLRRNEARPAYKIVPPLEMERMRENMAKTRLPNWVKVHAAEDIDDVLTIRPMNVNAYKKIHHIGDIQGCHDPLAEYFQTHGMHDDELYIFSGDWLDRGTQNAAVLSWALEHYNKPNIILIEGNHDTHLRNWADGEPVRSRQFNEATKPELVAAGIAKKKVHGFIYKFREVYVYTYREKTVVVTHGGISTLPKQLVRVSSQQLIRGVGAYEEVEAVDAAFMKATDEATYQLHGHRNKHQLPTQVNERCFNLEGRVEFGGELRVVVLDEDGFREQSVRSNQDATNSVISKTGAAPSGSQSVADLVATMRATPTIYEKPQLGTTISSFNFTREVFYKRAWDELNVHARGLFINTSTQRIVARSYEKFFNLGERPETQPDTLLQALKFPVRGWIKENGYLGLVGYDHETSELVFASKSSLTSEFAGWLHEQFDELVPNGTVRRREIEHYLSDGIGKTLVFEVIEPERDPHIVAYGARSLVLLDVVDNTPEFAVVDASERRRVAGLIGCKLKRQACELKTSDALRGWLAAVQLFDYEHSGEKIEGFVLEDADGFMVKIKLPWYSFWRQMRTQLERKQAGKKTKEPSFEIQPELAKAFLKYLDTKSTTELHEASIVDLRKEFEKFSDSV